MHNRMYLRSRIAVALCLLLTVAVTSAASTGAESPAVVTAQQVRTIWTSEFGVPHPAGLAHDPERNEFFVAGDESGAGRVVRIDPRGRTAGTFLLPGLSAPQTLAFDGARDELTALEGSDMLRVAGADVGDSRPQATRSPVDHVGLNAPRSAAYDRRGTWVVLDGDSAVVVDGQTDAVARLDLRHLNGPKLVAHNRSDDALYLMSANHRALNAVDASGNVIQTYDLSSVEISDPVAMTFAPSTDPTDDPSVLNLYVADSGGAQFGGVTEVSLEAVSAAAAAVDIGTLVQITATSMWTPASPDPSGVVWLPGAGELVVVDSEVNETTGAGWHDANLWRSTLSGVVVGVGTFWGPNAANGGFSDEPTGVGHDPITNTLFVSDDDAQTLWVILPGGDLAFGTSDDVVTAIDAGAYGSSDTEDPEFVNGFLYLLDGVGREIYRIDPVNAVFGDGDDQMTQFDISHLGPTDYEGLSSSPGRGTLYVGARTTEEIFEISTTGTLIRTIDVGGISQIGNISGLAVAPASNGSGELRFFVVDRGVDNNSDPSENDGRMFEIAAPDIGGDPNNQAPAAQDDTATTTEDSPVTIDVLSNDSDPDQDALSVSGLTQPANGSVVVNGDGTVTYAPSRDFAGLDTFTYTAFDGSLPSSAATVTVTVTAVNDSPVPIDDFASTRESLPVIIPVLDNDSDPDGDTLSVGSTSQAGDGLVEVNQDGTVTYSPQAGFSGTDEFTYEACDNAPACATAAVTVVVGDVTVQQYALFESTNLGSAGSGTLNDTQDIDGAFEQLVEEHSGGRPARRTSYLEHLWSFDLDGGDSSDFVVNGYREANADGDDFVFDYSTDGGATFLPLVVVNSTSPAEYRKSLPATTSGPVTVRVRDTDRSAGNAGTDSIFVDFLAFETVNPQAAQARVTVTPTDAAAAEDGNVGRFTYTRDNSAGSLTVLYSVSGTATPGLDYQTLDGSVTFAPGQGQVVENVVPIDDVLAEGSESVVVVLLDAVEYTVGQPAQASILIADDDQNAAESRALDESTSAGTVTGGDLTSTYFDDANREIITEESYAGNKRTRLEHSWAFSVQGGSQVQFIVQAHHDGAEQFIFAYSVGSGWIDMLTIAKNTDDGSHQSFSLPPGTSGDVSVRVIDADRSRGESTLESVYVDEMYFLSSN